MLAMAENYRTGPVWQLLRANPYVARGRTCSVGAQHAAPLRVACAMLSVAALAACRPAAGGVVLDFWGLGREGEVVAELMPAFERENPGIRVRVQQIPWTAAHEKLLTAYVGNATPDVAQLGNTWVPEFV